MQPQRKFEVAEPPVQHRDALRQVDPHFETWDAAMAASPARRLHQDLVAHFERDGLGAGTAIASPQDDVTKWPMPVRLTVIVASSIALWAAIGGIGLAVL